MKREETVIRPARRLIMVGVLMTSVVLSASLAAVAEAKVNYKGKTSQGERVRLRTGDGGVPSLLVIDWNARCTGDFSKVFPRTASVRPFDRANKKAFRDAGEYTIKSNGYKFEFNVGAKGKRVRPKLWKGTFRGSIAVSKNGNNRGHCSLKAIDWRASLS